MHKHRRAQGGMTGGKGKAIVMGLLERGGRVRAGVIAERRKADMQPVLENNLADGARLVTDEHVTYYYISDAYVHEVINHVEGYVKEHVHTNGIENFWSCLKRGLNGTYVSVEPYHLDRYVGEQVFRFNLRKGVTNANRFKSVLKDIVGRQLTYAELTGRVGSAAQA